MAFYKKSKLPPLRVSSSVSGSLSTSVTRRGQGTRSSSSSTIEASFAPFPDDPDSVDISEPLVNEPTSHELERKSAAKGWEQIRDSVLTAAVESSAQTVDQMCIMCSESKAVLRCLDCGPGAHYCEECFQNVHQNTNVFHVPEKWEVGFSYNKCCYY